uniref:ZP domain-containing protein n=1 Tax=Elaeophora elaphi TaxID=1147741 RepID=A0A0R3RIT6_9BILA
MLHLQVCRIFGNTIDNGVKGEPVLECAADSMSITFMTEKEFEGHVYVKGHYDNNLCRTNATLKENVNFTVPFSHCDVRRQRSSNPRGLYVCMTIIITFHPMFITRIDKSYHVKCFYMETDRTVTTRLDVSLNSEQQRKIIVMIGGDKHQVKALANRNGTMDEYESDTFSNGVITQQMALPTCRYQVLMDGPHGSPVKYTTVGERVYHQWSCADEDGTVSDKNLYCTTVHSCVAKEENGKEVQLLDENGCAVDRYLLDNLVYTSDLTGGQLSQVFKFADQSSLYFHCQIRLSLRRGSCKRTSDNCSTGPIRSKRELSIPSQDSDIDETVVDVFSQLMTVFDIDDPISTGSLKRFEAKELKHATICLAPTSFSFLLAVFITELLVSALLIIVLYWKTCYKQK